MSLTVAFVGAGDPTRLTGGYLYHARVFDLLRANGVAIQEFSASAEAGFGAQLEAARRRPSWFELAPAADVIVVDMLACVACRPWLSEWKARRPIVAMVHELPSIANNKVPAYVRDAEADLLRAARRVITVSRHGARLLVERGVDSEHITIARPGCDRLPVSHAPRRRTAAVPSRALCVAQWIPRKGIDILIGAWLRARPDARLELIGEAEADPVYAAQIRDLVMTAGDSIIVRGPVDDAALSAAYRDADVFILPSHFEGYGMVYAEALLHGLPVIACDVGPVPEIVGPDAGILVPTRDVDALAAAINRFFGDSQLAATMTSAATRQARKLPTWQDTARCFHSALLDLSLQGV